MSLIWDDPDDLCMSRDEYMHNLTPDQEWVCCDSCGFDDGPFALIESHDTSVGYSETLLICRRCLEGA